MALDPRALEDISRFLAGRFPDAAPELCVRAGLVPPDGADAEAWSHVLADANDAALVRLTDVLAAEAPGDVQVAAACRELRGTSVALFRLALAVAFAGFAIAGAMYARDAGTRPAPRPPIAASAEAPATGSAADPGAAAQPVVDGVDEDAAPTLISDSRPPAGPYGASFGPAPPPSASPAADAAAATAIGPSLPPGYVAPVAAAAPGGVAGGGSPPPQTAPTAPPAAKAAEASVPRCDTLPGTVSGWWFASADAPVKVGDVVIVRRGSRVRIRPPKPTEPDQRHAAPVCFIPAGGMVRVSGPAVDAAPHGWWAPYHAGDLLPPEVGPAVSPAQSNEAPAPAAAPDAPTPDATPAPPAGG